DLEILSSRHGSFASRVATGTFCWGGPVAPPRLVDGMTRGVQIFKFICAQIPQGLHGPVGLIVDACQMQPMLLQFQKESSVGMRRFFSLVSEFGCSTFAFTREFFHFHEPLRTSPPIVRQMALQSFPAEQFISARREP